jgi:hypothetical protein
MKIQNKNKAFLLVLIGTVLMFASCKKYYFDTGVHDPKYNGSVLQYMKAKQPFFDSTLTVINLAGMNDVLDKETITFLRHLVVLF